MCLKYDSKQSICATNFYSGIMNEWIFTINLNPCRLNVTLIPQSLIQCNSCYLYLWWDWTDNVIFHSWSIIFVLIRVTGTIIENEWKNIKLCWVLCVVNCWNVSHTVWQWVWLWRGFCYDMSKQQLFVSKWYHFIMYILVSVWNIWKCNKVLSRKFLQCSDENFFVRIKN